jgi:hypothetical protein
MPKRTLRYLSSRPAGNYNTFYSGWDNENTSPQDGEPTHTTTQSYIFLTIKSSIDVTIDPIFDKKGRITLILRVDFCAVDQLQTRSDIQVYPQIFTILKLT